VKTHYRGERIRVDGCGTYREVWLTSPERRNALDVTMRDELFEALGAIAIDERVAVVGLLSEGPDFCAGGDLNEFGAGPDSVTALQIRLTRSLPMLFAKLGPKLVTGVQGAAVGAGIELAAFARVVLASSDARFRLPELAMGLLPGSGGTVSVSRRIGPQLTLEMILTGAWVDADVAARHGLVDSVVNGSALIDGVREVALA
jgi:enoyl-CoA hydratase/carnithine racemase